MRQDNGSPAMASMTELTAPLESRSELRIDANDVMATLSRHMLVDGYDLVLDLQASHGVWLVDARTRSRYLDLFSFVASSPLGMNPPQLASDGEFMRRLATCAVNKPANPDIYTVEYARFVATFARVLGDPALPYLFFIDGGALAVENALKAAFDWKARRLLAQGRPHRNDLKVLHLERAFHGRSGYTLALTNTKAVQTEFFPTFDWPRIRVPAARFPLEAHREANCAAEREALDTARAAFEASGDSIACFIAETIQGEGGDNHMRPEFLHAMQALCREHDALFVLDEVQVGCGATGKAWAYQHFDLEPDLVVFGKKTQVCGVMGGRRIQEVPENVFCVSSRISSTWGGNLADMVRATRIFEVIERERLFDAAARRGAYLLDGLHAVAARFPRVLDNVRGRGLLCAVDLPDSATRDALINSLFVDEHVIILPCGTRSIRFRPALTITESEIDTAIERLGRCLRKSPWVA